MLQHLVCFLGVFYLWWISLCFVYALICAGFGDADWVSCFVLSLLMSMGFVDLFAFVCIVFLDLHVIWIIVGIVGFHFVFMGLGFVDLFCIVGLFDCF